GATAASALATGTQGLDPPRDPQVRGRGELDHSPSATTIGSAEHDAPVPAGASTATVRPVPVRQRRKSHHVSPRLQLRSLPSLAPEAAAPARRLSAARPAAHTARAQDRSTGPTRESARPGVLPRAAEAMRPGAADRDGGHAANDQWIEHVTGTDGRH